MLWAAPGRYASSSRAIGKPTRDLLACLWLPTWQRPTARYPGPTVAKAGRSTPPARASTPTKKPPHTARNWKALSSAPEAYQQKLPQRRDLHQGEGRGQKYLYRAWIPRG